MEKKNEKSDNPVIYSLYYVFFVFIFVCVFSFPFSQSHTISVLLMLIIALCYVAVVENSTENSSEYNAKRYFFVYIKIIDYF